MHRDDLASFKARLDTFKDWPNKNINPVDLANAGFYYLGKKDKCRCHDCGLGMHQWENLDNPWVEHAKYSDKCKYLIENTSQDFINMNFIKINDIKIVEKNKDLNTNHK